jgi:hypothetical protein
VAAGTYRQKVETEMKKLSIAIAVLATAAVFAGPLLHQQNSPKANRQTVLSTIQGQNPPPTCPPDCGGDPPAN